MAYGEMFATTSLSTIVESTFSPTIVGVTTPGAGTYSLQLGRYKQYSTMTYYFMRCTWSAHTGTGKMEMDGYPSSPAGSNSAQRFFQNLTLTDGTNTYPDMIGLLLASNDNVEIKGQRSGGNSDLNLDTSGDLIFCGGALI